MANTWNQVGTLMGPQGPKGATGATGAKGGSVRVASIDVKDNSDVAFSALAPSDGVQVGDVVIDANGDVYVVASVNPGAAYGGTWVMRPSQNGFIWERTA